MNLAGIVSQSSSQVCEGAFSRSALPSFSFAPIGLGYRRRRGYAPVMRLVLFGLLSFFTVGATDDAARRSAAVRDLLSGAREVESRCALLGLLPACGDAPALAALKAVVGDADSRVRDTAVRAEAQAAVKRIAEAIKDKHPEAAKAALERASGK
jgi:hypothetical protein